MFTVALKPTDDATIIRRGPMDPLPSTLKRPGLTTVLVYARVYMDPISRSLRMIRKEERKPVAYCTRQTLGEAMDP